MPFAWSFTIAASAALFGVSAWFTRRIRWLSTYLAVCCPLSFAWLWIHGHVPYWTRPVTLILQTAAVIEAICLLHENCWNPARRYWLAGFLTLCAIAGTFAAVEYPGYPVALWWAQLWVEASATIGCFTALVVWLWFQNFRPVGWTIGNVAVMGIYSGIELVALLVGSHLTVTNWLNVDIGLALAQDVCLFWWICLHTRHL